MKKLNRNQPIRLSILLVLFCALMLVLSSCAQVTHTITAEGRRVKIFNNPQDFPQCIPMGTFKSVALNNAHNSYQQALIKIKNKTAIYQGTHLQINFSSTDKLATTIEGDAYKCQLTLDGQIKKLKIKRVGSPPLLE